MSTLQIRVYGEPAPQGSKRHVGKGIMVESSKKVKPWREAVKWAALEEMKGKGKISGPVDLWVEFFMPRPKSKSIKRFPHCDVKPDIDKLLRSTFDALSDVQAYEDDARVVMVKATKNYADKHPPGALITIWEAK